MYASKYLTKYPENGFPDWVMDATYRIRRYSTSRGFWGKLSHHLKIIRPTAMAKLLSLRTPCPAAATVLPGLHGGYPVDEKADEQTGWR